MTLKSWVEAVMAPVKGAEVRWMCLAAAALQPQLELPPLPPLQTAARLYCRAAASQPSLATPAPLLRCATHRRLWRRARSA